MEERICQSCSMPLTEANLHGTNKDGSPNEDYCIYCYKDGKFLEEMSLEEYIEVSLKYADQIGMTREQMREHCDKVLPTLKRWKTPN